MDSLILVADFGTSNIRVNAICVRDGSTVLHASRAYGIHSPQDGWCELDFKEMWEKCQDCMEEVVRGVDTDRYAIKAINFSYFGACLVLADERGEVLSDAILCFDPRGGEQAARVNERLTTQKMIELTGDVCDPSGNAARLIWYKENRPELWKKSDRYYTNQQYVNRKLGLPDVNDFSMGAIRGVMDNRVGRWAPELTQELGFPTARFGGLTDARTVIGEIDRFGRVELPCRVKVLPGLHDAVAGFIGMGVYDENEPVVAEVTGTFDHVGFIANGHTNCFKDHPERSIWSSRGPFENTSSTIGVFSTSGALLEWFMRELLCDVSAQGYARMWDAVQFDGAGTVTIDPSFSDGRGAIEHLGVTTKREEIFKAIIEVLTFETKRCLDNCEAVKRGGLERVRICGGQSKADAWNQLRADLTGKTFESMCVAEGSALGAAVLAAVAVGEYPNVEAACRSMVHIRRTYTPRPEVWALYREKYDAYRKGF